ncbi:hypothetical protein, conserved, partial [Eimeria tenella]
FNVAKAEWRMSRKVRKLFVGEDPLPRAAVASKYKTALSQEAADELALYFIQLDIDKPNGVRRSDALALVASLGFDPKNKVCGNFVRSGKGRPIEVAELIEALLLDEEAHPEEAAAYRQQQQEQQQQEQQEQQQKDQQQQEQQQQQQEQQHGEQEKQQQQEQQQESEKKDDTSSSAAAADEAAAAAAAAAGIELAAGIPVSLPGEKPQERVLRILREANARARPTAWAIPSLERIQPPLAPLLQQQLQQQQLQQQQLQQQQQQQDEDSPEEAREELQLRLQIVQKTLRDLQALAKRQ